MLTHPTVPDSSSSSGISTPDSSDHIDTPKPPEGDSAKKIQLNYNLDKLFEPVLQIYRERNAYQDKLRGLVARGRQRRAGLHKQQQQLDSTYVVEPGHEDEDCDEEELAVSAIMATLDCSAMRDREEAQRRDAELHDCRAKLRAQREWLKEKSEDLDEYREEVRQYQARLVNLQKEKEELGECCVSSFSFFFP